MSKSAIAFLAGMGEGYLDSQERQKRQARQDKLDQITFGKAEREADEYALNKRNQAALADAGKDLRLNENAATLDITGKPVLYEDADVAASDYRQARNMAMAAKTGANFYASAPKPAFSVGGQTYAERDGAMAALQAGNTTEGRTKRMATVLYGQGKHGEAMQLESSARKNRLEDIQLGQAEKAQAHDQAFREITEGISRAGWAAVPRIYENYRDGNTATVAQDGKGGATVSIFNAKGEPVGQKTYAAELDFITDTVARLGGCRT